MVEIHDEEIQAAIHDLIAKCGESPLSFDGELVKQMIETSIKLLTDKHDTGQLKLMNRALKEMRYAYHVFNEYKGARCVSLFGSARTPQDHPDYIAAREFSTQMTNKGWMCITGAANGIMQAGLEGAAKQSSFGLSIRLPFEVPTSSFIEGDPKHIFFRYYFTRKLMFLSHSDALAAFPGGFGTMDELFEALTMIQTGKNPIVPIVLLEGASGVYWKYWKQYIDEHLEANGWTSPEDQHFYYIAPSPEAAVEHIQKFYRRYHSSRYVKDLLVLRLLTPISDEDLAILNKEFAEVVESGVIFKPPPFPEETDYLELPRLALRQNRKHMGLLRALIDRINAL